MDQALELVRPGGERPDFDLATRRRSGRAKQGGVGTLRNRRQPEQSVERRDTATAEVHNLGEGVELAASVVGVDLAARRDTEVQRNGDLYGKARRSVLSVRIPPESRLQLHGASERARRCVMIRSMQAHLGA